MDEPEQVVSVPPTKPPSKPPRVSLPPTEASPIAEALEALEIPVSPVSYVAEMAIESPIIEEKEEHLEAFTTPREEPPAESTSMPSPPVTPTRSTSPPAPPSSMSSGEGNKSPMSGSPKPINYGQESHGSPNLVKMDLAENAEIDNSPGTTSVKGAASMFQKSISNHLGAQTSLEEMKRRNKEAAEKKKQDEIDRKLAEERAAQEKIRLAEEAELERLRQIELAEQARLEAIALAEQERVRAEEEKKRLLEEAEYLRLHPPAPEPAAVKSAAFGAAAASSSVISHGPPPKPARHDHGVPPKTPAQPAAARAEGGCNCIIA